MHFQWSKIVEALNDPNIWVGLYGPDEARLLGHETCQFTCKEQLKKQTKPGELHDILRPEMDFNDI